MRYGQSSLGESKAMSSLWAGGWAWILFLSSSSGGWTERKYKEAYEVRIRRKGKASSLSDHNILDAKKSDLR